MTVPVNDRSSIQEWADRSIRQRGRLCRAFGPGLRLGALQCPVFGEVRRLPAATEGKHGLAVATSHLGGGMRMGACGCGRAWFTLIATNKNFPKTTATHPGAQRRRCAGPIVYIKFHMHPQSASSNPKSTYCARTYMWHVLMACARNRQERNLQSATTTM